MSAQERRWVVPPSRSPQDPKAYWEAAHTERMYEDVFSVGEDPNVRRVVTQTALESNPRTVLLAGCGSRTELQAELMSQGPDEMSVVATDFECVVAMAERCYRHERLTYVPLESRPRFIDRFDVVVAVNVLVSESDLANRALVDEWATALTPSGELVALLPILFAGLDLALLSGREDLRNCLDLEQSSWTEKRQGVRQIEYSPLRLRRVLKEAGLRLEQLRIVFLDGDAAREQSRLHYDLADEDLPVYEQLVVATR